MKVSEAVHHIKQTHAGIAGGLRKEAEHHRNMSNIHKAELGKAVAVDSNHDFHKCAKAEHDDMATDRETRAKYHDDMMSECDKALKALTADDLNKNASDDLVKRVTALENTVIPTRVSAVVPTVPGVTAVPRAGQRPYMDRPIVATQFQKLVEVEE
jgi:hypothetical protein